jgi:L-ascorbate metabolism protein UlaG (beta-lactamase superfamily)
MKNGKLFLKYNAKAEPLRNQWYAVSLAVPPVTGAMFLANSHLKIMKSYIQSPEMHAAASEDPAMMGGPFMNYKENRVPQIRSLLDKTLTEKAHLISFAEAVKSLSNTLRKEAKGYSMEPLYKKVPDVLKGFVELVYDMDNNPSFRFIEALLYESQYYDRSGQAMGLSLVDSDDRPFVLSTPRLEEDGYLHLNLPFNHSAYDELFKMKREPRPFEEIKEMLGFDNERDDLFRSFLTETQPPQPENNRYDGEGVRIRYFGHACLLVETKDVSIITDPLISYKYDSDIPRLTFADLPDEIDYVIITHAHLDHSVLEALLQLRHKVKNVLVPRNNGGMLQDPSLRLLLKSVGFNNVSDIDEMESVELPGGSITSLPFLGEHHDLFIRSKTSYLISLPGKTVCVAADSCNLETRLCEHLGGKYLGVDALFLGMECDGAPLSWFYGPLLARDLERAMDYSRQGSACNHRRAIDMAKKLKCKQVYVYAMGLEPWLNYIMSINWNDESIQIRETKSFIEDCHSQGIGAEMLFGQKTIHL